MYGRRAEEEQFVIKSTDGHIREIEKLEKELLMKLQGT